MDRLIVWAAIAATKLGRHLTKLSGVVLPADLDSVLPFTTSDKARKSRPELGHKVTLIGINAVFLWLGVDVPDSLTYRLLAESHGYGDLFLGALLVLTVFTAADLVVNDMLPKRVSIRPLKKVRVQTYMAISLLHMSLVITALMSTQPTSPLLFTNVVLSFGHAWVAVLDTYLRFVLPRRAELYGFQGDSA